MQGDCSRLSSLLFLGNIQGFGYESPKENLEVGLINFRGDLGVKVDKTIRMQGDCSRLCSLLFLGNSF